jgi:hypothetical protein
MRNLHLIPTDGIGKIFYIAENFHLEKGQLIEPKSYYHIYITSDDYPLDGEISMVAGNHLSKFNSKFTSMKEVEAQWRKIILTTDQDLIADGVQAIDDVFLEWFVKNPTYKFIKTKRITSFTNGRGYVFLGYTIIIPQEEPKQEKWDKLNKELDDALEEAFGTSPSNILDVFENAKLVLREHLIANKEEVVKDLEQMREWSNTNKQETLEEAAEKRIPTSPKVWDLTETRRSDFKAGAKWMLEKLQDFDTWKEWKDITFKSE